MTTKLAVVAPAAIVTDEGVVSNALLSDSVTVVAVIAALFKATVQVLVASGPRTTGVQLREESVAGALRVSAAVCEAPLRVAVTVAG